MRIAYVTTYDPDDVGRVSGLGYFVLQALRRAGCDVHPIGPLTAPRRPSVLARRAYHRFVTRRDYLGGQSTPIARGLAAEVARRLAGRRFDIVFAPETLPVAYLEGDWPVVTYSDATFAALLDFYYLSSGLAAESISDGMRTQTRVIARASISVYASDWAAASAIDDFGADERSVHVVPFGANLEEVPSAAGVGDAVSRRPTDHCALLFIGVDWERKGGSTVLQVAEALNRRGLPTRLTIVGCKPPIPERLAPYVEVRGNLDKRTDAKELSRVLETSHLLVLPTRAEAYGHALCEANAFGVPALSTRVGGVPTVVRPGRNGMLFDVAASADEYAGFVAGLFENYERYLRLAHASREEFEKRLNWTVAGAKLKSLLETV